MSSIIFNKNIKEIIKFLNNKNNHDLKIISKYKNEDEIDATFDVFCENCGINFNLDLFKNKTNEGMYQWVDIFYLFNIYDDTTSFNMVDCYNISCEEWIIKGIIE